MSEDHRPTLDNQIEKAKINARADYAKQLLRAYGGERSSDLYHKLLNPPEFVRREGIKLFSKILMNDDHGKSTPVKYVKKTNNLPGLAYIIALDVVEIKDESYFGIFKRKVIVPKNRMRTEDE